MLRSLFILALLLGGCSADSGLIINELVASNSSGLTDEGGAYPDWIELYNVGGEAVSLDGWYLADDEAEVEPWALDSSLEVSAEGYLVLYADGDTDEGPLHLDFKLKASGEQVVLRFGEDREIVDVVTFGEQQTDVAWALLADGTWGPATPTPGEANE